MNDVAIRSMIDSLWYHTNDDYSILVIVPVRARALWLLLRETFNGIERIHIKTMGASLTGLAIDMAVLVDLETTSSYFQYAIMSHARSPQAFSFIQIKRSPNDRVTNRN